MSTNWFLLQKMTGGDTVDGMKTISSVVDATLFVVIISGISETVEGLRVVLFGHFIVLTYSVVVCIIFVVYGSSVVDFCKTCVET